MKTGRTLVELAAEIERQATTAQDYLAATDAVEMVVAGEKGLQLALASGTDKEVRLDMRELAHEQLSGYLDIPRKYYDRMRGSQPELLAHNVNTWMREQRDRKGGTDVRMIRTLDGSVRAVLSNSYRCMNNADLAEAVFPVLAQMELEVLSCEITERRLYIKAVDKRITVDCPTGKRMGDASHTFFDTVSPAIVVSNSEVGCGALSVETAIWTKVCTNMAIASQRSMRKYHLGSRADLGEEVMAVLSDRTRAVTDAALWLQVRDVTAAAFDRAKLEAYVNETLVPAVEAKIEGDPVKAVELIAKKIGINDTERGGVLRHLIEGGDLSQYGMHAAVTRLAEDLPDYDRATEFERLGTRVLELPRGEWQVVAKAA